MCVCFLGGRRRGALVNERSVMLRRISFIKMREEIFAVRRMDAGNRLPLWLLTMALVEKWAREADKP